MKVFFSILMFCTITLYIIASPNVISIEQPHVTIYSIKINSILSPNVSLCQDGRGMLYAGSDDGLHTFNGNKWNKVHSMNDIKVTALSMRWDDRIYVGAKNEFGYLSYNNQGKPEYISLLEKLDKQYHNFGNINNIFTTADGTYFCANKNIFFYYNNKIRIMNAEIFQPIGTSWYYNNREIITLDKSRGLVLIKKNSISSLQGTEALQPYIDQGQLSFIIPYSTYPEVLIGMMTGEIFLYNFQKHKLSHFSHEMENYGKDNILLNAVKIDLDNFAFSTLKGDIFILNKKGKLKIVINSLQGFSDAPNHKKLFADREGNLWTSNREGLACIELGRYQMKYKKSYATLITKISNYKNSVVSDGVYYVSYPRPYGNYPYQKQPDSIIADYSHEKNSLIFEYTALWFSAPESIKYSCKLEGFNQEWSEWSSYNRKEYINLQPGKYTFKIKSLNQYGKESEISSYAFNIHPPWYTTPPLNIIYIIIGVGLLIFIIKRIIEVKQKLENTVQERTKELTEMDRQKTLFYQNITHELRTPLTLILGHTERILHQRKNHTQQNTQDIITIDKNAKKVHALINQLLDLSKIDSNSMEIKPVAFHLPQFIEYLTTGFSSLAKINNIEFKVEICNYIGLVYLDIHKLEDIVTNLLSNAFKFTDPDGIIIIEVTSNEEKSEFQIEIIDSGIGISEQDLPYIFDRFRQVDGSTSRKYEGTGIGLSLAQEYTQLHGGAIEVKSIVGEGSCFSVLLPVSYNNIDISTCDSVVNLSNYHFRASANQDFGSTRIEYPSLANDTTSPSNILTPQKPTIFIVEDNPDLLEFVTSCLETNYITITAENGKCALTKLQTSPVPDLIISDIMMPEMDGYEFYQSLKKNVKLQHIPFIFMTAKASIDDQVAGLDEGAIDYITKPFSFKTLIAKINSLLKFNIQRTALYERERFASLGKLVSSISHEILNPLSGMTGPLYYLTELINDLQIENKTELNEAITYLNTNIDRIDSVIKNLRSLNKYNSSDVQEVNVKKLIIDNLNLLNKKIENKIKMIINVDEDIILNVNPGALSHILLNIISNSCDAIAESGEITIKAEETHDKFTLHIEDNGCGISEKDLAYIFDLYFTTKSYNEGSGFGLYFVKDLIVKMGWSIAVESEINKGTSFILSNGIS